MRQRSCSRRQPYQIARLRDKPFPNDHLDLFFNAAGQRDRRYLHARGRRGRARLSDQPIRDRPVRSDRCAAGAGSRGQCITR